MRRPSRASRFAVVLAAALAVVALTPGVAAVEDVAALAAVPANPATRWRAHLVAVPVALSPGGALDGFDPRIRAGIAARLDQGTGFRLSAAPPADSADDGAPRGDRLALAPEARRLHARPALALAAFAEAGPIAPAPEGATPPALLSASTTTPGDGALPVATAALPVHPSHGLFANGRDPLLADARAAGAILQLAAQTMIAPADLPRAEKCMATAIYFEARGEPVRGQYAVAQVVMNRVRSPDFPNDVCGVVYQNADWYNHCQFSFACDGRAERVFDRVAWKRAEKIAADVIVKGVYLPDVGAATNYHADYVRPRWARYMIRKDKLGRHIFYKDPTLTGESAPLAFAGP